MTRRPAKPRQPDKARSAQLAELEASAGAAARLMKLLANEQRLILLCRLGQGECSVNDLADHVGLAQSAASQHLARLRADGVVATRREAQTIYYSLADPGAARVIELLCDLYAPVSIGRSGSPVHSDIEPS